MPRKPTFAHPLRDIRQAARLSQEQIAALVGVGKDTIQSIENGRLAMSDDLALKIRHQTGCDLDRRKDNHGRERFEIRRTTGTSRRLYSNEDFTQHRQMLEALLQEDAAHYRAAASQCIDLLLGAAARKRDGTLFALAADLEHFVGLSFERYRLAPQLSGLLEQEWLPLNLGILDVKKIVRNFPIIPLSTAFSFPLATQTTPKPTKSRREK